MILPVTSFVQVKESTDSSTTLEDEDNSSSKMNHHAHVTAAVPTVGRTGTVQMRVGSAGSAGHQSASGELARKQEIIRCTELLLDAIAAGDFESYSRLCDPNITCFEPEALSNLVEGTDFHKFYFDHHHRLMSGSSVVKQNVSVVNPHVHLLGEDAAAVAYVRVTQQQVQHQQQQQQQQQVMQNCRTDTVQTQTYLSSLVLDRFVQSSLKRPVCGTDRGTVAGSTCTSTGPPMPQKRMTPSRTSEDKHKSRRIARNGG